VSLPKTASSGLAGMVAPAAGPAPAPAVPLVPARKPRRIRVSLTWAGEKIDPLLADYGPVAWMAETEIKNDVLIIRGGAPFLDELAATAEKRPEMFAACNVVNADQGEYVDAGHRSSRRMMLSNAALPAPFPFYAALIGAIEASFAAAYVELVNPFAGVKSGSGFDLLRYGPGERFGLHVDAVRDHPTLVHRRLAIVGFCNKVEEGGELVFPRQDLTIVPEPGMFVVFPAGFTHPHESKPVVRGVKYSIAGWYF
jgi:hypothetical protein